MTQAIEELKLRLSSLAPIHFVGAAGSGMRPLAEFVSALDVETTGSDRGSTGDDISFSIASEGSAVDLNFLSKARTIVYSSAISKSHDSLLFAKKNELKMLHRSELLAIICDYFKTIAVAGTHGKSTTSAMVAHALDVLGEKPSWIIGAPFSSGQRSFHLGSGPWLVIEADESDGSFLRYSPYISVVTSIDADHMDFYQTVDRLQDAFKSYAENTDPAGGLVFCGDHETVKISAQGYEGRRVSYGFSPGNNLFASDYKVEALCAHSTVRLGQLEESLQLSLPGKHNTCNALAAIGVGTLIGCSLERASRALASFPGVQRRMQRYNNLSGFIIFDDYAHNPVKIASCIAGLSEAFPKRRIIACFQPHRFSRISALYADFIASFRAKNIAVVVLPVYASGEAPIKGFDPPRIAGDIARASGAQTFSASTFKGCAELIKSMADPEHDVIVTIGAGDVWQVARLLSLEL